MLLGRGKSLATSNSELTKKNIPSAHQTLPDILKPLWLQHSNTKKHGQQ